MNSTVNFRAYHRPAFINAVVQKEGTTLGLMRKQDTKVDHNSVLKQGGLQVMPYYSFQEP